MGWHEWDDWFAWNDGPAMVTPLALIWDVSWMLLYMATATVLNFYSGNSYRQIFTGILASMFANIIGVALLAWLNQNGAAALLNRAWKRTWIVSILAEWREEPGSATDWHAVLATLNLLNNPITVLVLV